MKHISFLWLLCYIVSCTEKPKDTPSNIYLEKSKSSCLDVQLWHQEFLDVDSVKINGKLPAKTTLSELIRIMGQPRKVLTKPIETSNLYYLAKNDKVNCYYYDDMLFEEYQGKVIIHTIDFREKNVEVILPRIKLNHKTLPIEVQNIFPESGRLMSGAGNSWSGYMVINAFQPYGHGKIWFLTFNKERLSKMILYDVPVYDL